MKKSTVAYVGNVANNDFREVKALQDSQIISAHLYLVNNKDDQTRLPESDEPVFKDNYPNWIFLHQGISIKFLSLVFFWFGSLYLLRKQNKEIVKQLNHYDLVVLSGEAVLLAPLIKTKSLFRVTGSDLTVYPLFSLREINTLYQTPTPIGILPKIHELIRWYLYQKLWRAGISKVAFTDAGFGQPFEDALSQLKYPAHKRISFFRLSIDTSLFKRSEELSSIYNKWGLCDKKFLVFQPSRQMIRREPFLVRTGQWKASDNGIRGFKFFLDRIPSQERRGIVLMIPERIVISDLQLAKQLVINLGIESNVVYLSGVSESGLTRHEMIDLYSISNAVLDDFGAGWFGSIVVESLACSAPVVTYVPEKLMQRMFPWHPFLIAQTPEQIADALYKLYVNKIYEQNVRDKSRQWATKFHSNDSVMRALEDGFQNILR